MVHTAWRINQEKKNGDLRKTNRGSKLEFEDIVIAFETIKRTFVPGMLAVGSANDDAFFFNLASFACYCFMKFQ